MSIGILVDNLCIGIVNRIKKLFSLIIFYLLERREAWRLGPNCLVECLTTPLIRVTHATNSMLIIPFYYNTPFAF